MSSNDAIIVVIRDGRYKCYWSSVDWDAPNPQFSPVSGYPTLDALVADQLEYANDTEYGFQFDFRVEEMVEVEGVRVIEKADLKSASFVTEPTKLDLPIPL